MDECKENTVRIPTLEELEAEERDIVEHLAMLHESREAQIAHIKTLGVELGRQKQRVEDCKQRLEKVTRLKVVARGIPDEIIKLREEVILARGNLDRCRGDGAEMSALNTELKYAISVLQGACPHTFIVCVETEDWRKDGRICLLCSLREKNGQYDRLWDNSKEGLKKSAHCIQEIFREKFRLPKREPWWIETATYNTRDITDWVNHADVFVVKKEDILSLFLEP